MQRILKKGLPKIVVGMLKDDNSKKTRCSRNAPSKNCVKLKMFSLCGHLGRSPRTDKMFQKSHITMP